MHLDPASCRLHQADVNRADRTGRRARTANVLRVAYDDQADFLFAGRGPQEARQDLQLGWGSFWARTWLTWSHSPVPPGQAVSGLLGRAVTGACSRLSSRIGAAVVGRSTSTPGPYGGGPASVGSKLGRHPPRRVRRCWSRRG